MIFSGSTAGGSGGRLSDLLPLRSRRAAAARSWAAILMGLEMVAARRFAAPRGVLRRRREFSEQRCLASWLSCRAARRISRSADRLSIDRSKPVAASGRGARAAAYGHAFFVLASVLQALASCVMRQEKSVQLTIYRTPDAFSAPTTITVTAARAPARGPDYGFQR